MNFEDFLRWHNISLIVTDLPPTVKGFATYYGMEYLVLINARCSQEQQQDTLIHELIHVMENHFAHPKWHDCEYEVENIIHGLKLIRDNSY